VGVGRIRKWVGEGGRNDPNIVCTYELKKKEKDNFVFCGLSLRINRTLSENL
jgi:hypothetical protein